MDFTNIGAATIEHPRKPKLDFSDLGAKEIGNHLDFSDLGEVAVDEPLREVSLLSKLKTTAETPSIPIKSRIKMLSVLTSDTPEGLKKKYPLSYGFLSATTQMAEGLTSPENVALMMASGARLPKLVQQVASGGFGAIMAKELPHLYRQYNDALRSGDKEESMRLGTLLVGQGLFSLMGLKEGFIPESGTMMRGRTANLEEQRMITEERLKSNASSIPADRMLPPGSTINQGVDTRLALPSPEQLSKEEFGNLPGIKFHGSFSENIPSKLPSSFGGIHLGTKKAALERIETTRPHIRGGRPGGGVVMPVRVNFKNPLGSESNPVNETELFLIVNTPSKLNALKSKGYDGIIYRNIVEDPGSISYLALDRKALETYADYLGKKENLDVGENLPEAFRRQVQEFLPERNITPQNVRPTAQVFDKPVDEAGLVRMKYAIERRLGSATPSKKQIGPRWDNQKGAVLNPVDFLDSIITVARESDTFFKFREKVLSDRDLRDTYKVYFTNLQEVWDNKDAVLKAIPITDIVNKVGGYSINEPVRAYQLKNGDVFLDPDPRQFRMHDEILQDLGISWKEIMSSGWYDKGKYVITGGEEGFIPPKFDTQRGQVLNPVAVADVLLKIAKDSKSYLDFREQVSKNQDLKDTVRAYSLSLQNIYDKRGDKETLDTIGALDSHVHTRPKISEEEIDLAHQTGNDNMVMDTSQFNSDLIPGKKEEGIINNMREYLQKSQETIPFSKNIQDDLNTIKTRAVADEIRAKQLLQKTDLKPRDAEAIYHHVENPLELLTPDQQNIFQNTIEPIRQEREQLFAKLKNEGVPLSQDSYTPRFTANKGGVFDRLLSEAKSVGIRSGILRTSTGAFKHRTMKILVDEQGNRVVAAIKGDQVTAFINKIPTYFGRLNLKSYEDLMNSRLSPLDERIKKLKTEYKTLTATKGRQEASPLRINNIQDEVASLEGQRQEIIEQYDLSELNRKTMFSQGRRWTVGEATTKEIEQSSGLTYHKNILLNELITYNNLRKVDRAIQFLESVKTAPEFSKVAIKFGKSNIPDKWKSTDLPQFRGYAFEPRVADTLNKFYKDTQRGGSPYEAFSKINDFLRGIIFFNPLIHVPNITMHWLVARGTKAWAIPPRYVTLIKTGSKAIEAVIHQNKDYLDMLDSGVNLLYHKYGGEKLHELMLKKMGEEIKSNPGLAESLGDALGYVNPMNLYNALLKFSGKVTWATNDIAMMQHIYEEMALGKSMETAIRDTSEHIPDYRIPARILNSRLISEIMSNSNITMFGAYHFGALKSYGEMVKDVVKNVPEGERGEAIDKMVMLGLTLQVIYPALDKLAQGLTGKSGKWKFRRAGPATFPYNTYRFLKDKIDLSQYLESVITPAVGFKLAVETLSNRNWVTGGRLIRRGHIVNDALKAGIEATAPLAAIRGIESGRVKPENFLYSLSGFRRER